MLNPPPPERPSHRVSILLPSRRRTCDASGNWTKKSDHSMDWSKEPKKAIGHSLVGVDFSIFLGGCKKGNIYRKSISETTIFTCRCSCWPILGNHIGEVAELSFSSFSLSWCFLILYSRLAGSGWIITHSIIMQNPQGKTNKQTEKSKQTNKQTNKQPNNQTTWQSNRQFTQLPNVSSSF